MRFALEIDLIGRKKGVVDLALSPENGHLEIANLTGLQQHLGHAVAVGGIGKQHQLARCPADDLLALEARLLQEGPVDVDDQAVPQARDRHHHAGKPERRRELGLTGSDGLFRPTALGDVQNGRQQARLAIHLDYRGREKGVSLFAAAAPDGELHAAGHPVVPDRLHDAPALLRIGQQASLLGRVPDHLRAAVPGLLAEGVVDLDEHGVAQPGDGHGDACRLEGGLKVRFAGAPGLDGLGRLANARLFGGLSSIHAKRPQPVLGRQVLSEDGRILGCRSGL